MTVYDFSTIEKRFTLPDRLSPFYYDIVRLPRKFKKKWKSVLRSKFGTTESKRWTILGLENPAYVSCIIKKYVKVKKINVELKSLNGFPENEIEKLQRSNRGMIKVVTEQYYETYETDEGEMRWICEDWFDRCANSSHAYRDGSRLPMTNLISVEIIKNK
jgi:hypothetical protein